MSGRGKNSRMFALSSVPPREIHIAGFDYSLIRVFKHDFWAATCLYGSESTGAEFNRAVVKFSRRRSFAGLPLETVGRWLVSREEAMYARLGGITGIPRWIDRLSSHSFAIEYIDGNPLDHYCGDDLPDDFFDRLKGIIEEIHGRGIAYVDANKKSNILVRPDGSPALIDFQISLAYRPDWMFPLRNITERVIGYLQSKDMYHLYKHKRRMVPELLTPGEEAVSRHRSLLHKMHRRLSKLYRNLRRNYLGKKYHSGELASPTAELENHYQPEKESWRRQER